MIRFLMFRGFFFLSLLLFSCSREPAFIEVTADGRIRMNIPASMVIGTNPNEDALLHYEDTMRSLYLMVVAESKDTMLAYEMDYNISSYFEETCLDLASKLSGSKSTGLNSEKISGMPAFTSFITGSAGKENVMYAVAAVETKKHFYQLITAFPQEDSLRFKEIMLSSIRSFKEL